LRDDGTIWAWGQNFYGQLGNGTTSNSFTPAQVTGVGGATFIAAGSTHSLALAQFLPPTGCKLASSANPSIYGESITFTASVDPLLQGGTIQFLDDGSNLGAPVSIDSAGQATYTTSSLSAGDHTITTICSGLKSFASINNALTQNVKKADPIITWDNPADIVYGTALGDEQLNATASVPGSFTYTPPPGTVLSAGPNQVLNATFIPADAENYNYISVEVEINVLDYFSGFFSLPGNRSYKLGSTIPIKWVLADAIGNSNGDLKMVSSLLVGPVGEALADPTPAGGTVLRYEAAANQFIFNWKTKGLKAGDYIISLSLTDGTSRTIEVTLKP